MEVSIEEMVRECKEELREIMKERSNLARLIQKYKRPIGIIKTALLLQKNQERREGWREN